MKTTFQCHDSDDDDDWCVYTVRLMCVHFQKHPNQAYGNKILNA